MFRRQQVSASTLSVKNLIKSGGLFKGLGPAIGTQPVYWAINMPLYNGLKKYALEQTFYQQQPQFLVNMSIGFTSGAVATVITNPLWMLRQRMQTETIKGKTNRYDKLIREVYSEDGIRTFFRGTSVTMMKNVQMALLLPLFEQLNSLSIWSDIGMPQSVAAGVSGAASKIIASTGVYPLDVIRTNMRFREGKKAPFVEIAREIIRRPGGLFNLFRGIGWYWIGSSGTFAVMMGLQSLTKN